MKYHLFKCHPSMKVSEEVWHLVLSITTPKVSPDICPGRSESCQYLTAANPAQWYRNLSEEFPKLLCLMPACVLASYQPHWCWRGWERRGKKAEHWCSPVCLHREGGVPGTADSSPMAGHPPGPAQLQLVPHTLLSPPHPAAVKEPAWMINKELK